MKKPFTEKEISMASKKLRNGKSPGIDNMYAEYIKYAPGTTHQQRQIQGRGVRGAGTPFFNHLLFLQSLRRTTNYVIRS